MKQKDSWFLKIWDDKNPEVFGIGEAGPLPGLSPEKPAEVEKEFEAVGRHISKSASLDHLGSPGEINGFLSQLKLSSSVTFAVEMALLDLKNLGVRTIFKNSFLKGQPIPINGLVWMGGLDEMLSQVSIKIDEGFTCIKLKIGGNNFEKEVDILQFIRRKYYKDVITIRLDANGAFKPAEALYKLEDCSRYDIHSIEQPVKPGLPIMADLCKKSPIPIALDEELIGVNTREEKVRLLERIIPQFIILKPTIHGGMSGCEEWIRLAEERSVGWWMTSSLESNIGLNAIAQFTANHSVKLPQGLGTGAIYNNNIPSPLEVKKGALCHNSQENWDYTDFN